MKDSNNYNTQQGFALLLMGPPKSGKSCLAGRFPKPYFVDIDGNLNSVKLFQERSGIKTGFKYDILTHDSSGNPVPLEKRYDLMIQYITEAIKSPDIETVVVDSLTTLVDVMLSHIMRMQGRSQLAIQDWGTFQQMMTKLVYTLRGTGKYIIFTAHEESVKDETTGIVVTKLAMPGQLQNKLGAYFSDIWHTEIDQRGNEYKYVIRTVPTPRIALGNSLGLPPVWEFKWSDIEGKLTKPVCVTTTTTQPAQ